MTTNMYKWITDKCERPTACQGFALQGVVVCSSREQKEQFVNEMCETEGWAYYKQPSILQKEGHASLAVVLEEHLPDSVTGKHLICAFFLEGTGSFKHIGVVYARLRHPAGKIVDTNIYYISDLSHFS